MTNWVTVTGLALVLGGFGIPVWFRREIFGVGGRRRARRNGSPRPAESAGRPRPSRMRSRAYAGTHYGGRVARPARVRHEPAAREFVVTAHRIDGWVRPQYRDLPEPDSAPPPEAEPYGWPVPIERPAVYAAERAAG